MVGVVGYLSENKPGWPPAYESAREEQRESLGVLIRGLRVDEGTYEQLVGIARDMLADPDFCRLRDAIARALSVVPRLEREDIERLSAIYLTDEEEVPCPS